MRYRLLLLIYINYLQLYTFYVCMYTFNKIQNIINSTEIIIPYYTINSRILKAAYVQVIEKK